MSVYSFQCNRCTTSATDSSRRGIEMFSEHHMRTMHPLFTADAARTVFAPKPKRRRIRSSRISPCPSRVGA